MIKTDKPLRQQTKSSRSASRENIDHVGEMTYVFMSDIDESSTTSQEAGAVSKSAKPLPPPKIKPNLAYDEVKIPEVEQS